MSSHGPMMGMATVEQVYALDTLPVAEAEIAFLQLMIRHHQGGVAMARTVLNQTTRPELPRLANSIVIGQQSEISYMKELLLQNYPASFLTKSNWGIFDRSQQMNYYISN
jgi:uncharacterized protein (DUF305 family)